MKTTVKETGILFKPEMVRAILRDEKTQTRRIVSQRNSEIGTGVPWAWLEFDDSKVPTGAMESFADNGYLHIACKPHPNDPQDNAAFWTRHRVYPKLEVGDRLWVRETWAYFGGEEYLYQRDPANVVYCADFHDDPRSREWQVPRWRPSIFMPRWASRITLEITDVRVERLQDISEADAKAEGVDGTRKLYRCPLCGHVDHDEQDGTGHWEKGGSQTHMDDPGWSYWTLFCNGCNKITDMPEATSKETFTVLWDRINVKVSWKSNCWVWCISFKRV